MTEIKISAALLRTLHRFQADPRQDHAFESGARTKPATQAHLKQTAGLSAERAVAKARRQRPTSEERRKQVDRRRKWGSGGHMPPNVAGAYSEGERAAMNVIADRCKRKGFCDLCLDEIARVAGVSRTTVQNAVRKAQSVTLGHVSVRERPQRGGKSLTNIIKIVCKSWLGWIARAIGFKRLNPSVTGVKNSLSDSFETLLSPLSQFASGRYRSAAEKGLGAGERGDRAARSDTSPLGAEAG